MYIELESIWMFLQTQLRGCSFFWVLISQDVINITDINKYYQRFNNKNKARQIQAF